MVQPLAKQSELLDSYAYEWILGRSLLMAQSLNETTITALRSALAEGFALGEGVPKLSKRIEQYFDVNAKYRARVIARTEVIAASNEGALHRYEISGIEKSEFYPSYGACDECLAKAGEYPTREAHGMIPVHPNCRCVFLPVV